MFFLFSQKTAYDMRISDWSSDVCSSDLVQGADKCDLKRRAEKAPRPMCAEHQEQSLLCVGIAEGRDVNGEILALGAALGRVDRGHDRRAALGRQRQELRARLGIGLAERGSHFHASRPRNIWSCASSPFASALSRHAGSSGNSLSITDRRISSPGMKERPFPHLPPPPHPHPSTTPTPP